MEDNVSDGTANPSGSCGLQILTSRVGWSKRAWYAQGQVLQTFQNEIRPFVDELLQHLETQHADIFIRAYMIGRKPKRADPFLFVCCTNIGILHEADQCIRNSNFAKRFPGFRLGKSALPLEAQVPLLRIGYEQISEGEEYSAREESPISKELMSADVRVGSSLSYAGPITGGSYSAKATGGPVLSYGTGVYQLTARHFWDNSAYPGPRNLDVSDLEYCDFDGQGEDDGVDDDSNYEAMSIASASSAATSRSSSSTTEQAASLGSTPIIESNIRLSGRGTLRQTKVQADASTPAHPEPLLDTAASASVSKITRRGEAIMKSGVTPLEIIEPFNDTPLHRGLDYTLLRIPHAERQSLRCPNSFEIDGRSMALGAASEIPLYRTEIIALCGSSGPGHGVLLPGAISHLYDGLSTTIYQVQLENAVERGDSGSAIVDATTGSWYGQITFGCPGTNQAYLVPAIDIWRDLNVVQNRGRHLYFVQSGAAEDLHDCALDHTGYCVPLAGNAATQPPRQDSSNWPNSLSGWMRAIIEALPLLYTVASAVFYAVVFVLLYISLYCFRGLFTLVKSFWKLPWASSSRGRTNSHRGRAYSPGKQPVPMK